MSARRAAAAIAGDCRLEIDAHLIGKCGHPSQDIGELVLLLISSSLANRLGQLSDFFCEPCDS